MSHFLSAGAVFAAAALLAGAGGIQTLHPRPWAAIRARARAAKS
jgi:hypothetical protein